MRLDQLRELALSHPGTTEDLKWGHDLCFLVAEKMFLVLGPDAVPVSASFKTTDEIFEELISRNGIIPAPYLARNKWVQVQDIGTLSSKEWAEHVGRSYELVRSKLPLKVRRALEAM
jgi:predicted DNA-binding protein (MmcQ/YjbR family)